MTVTAEGYIKEIKSIRVEALKFKDRSLDPDVILKDTSQQEARADHL
jgi:hypothetical protein